MIFQSDTFKLMMNSGSLENKHVALGLNGYSKRGIFKFEKCSLYLYFTCTIFSTLNRKMA